MHVPINYKIVYYTFYQLIKIEEPDTWECTVRNVGFRREKL